MKLKHYCARMSIGASTRAARYRWLSMARDWHVHVVRDMAASVSKYRHRLDSSGHVPIPMMRQLLSVLRAAECSRWPGQARILIQGGEGSSYYMYYYMTHRLTLPRSETKGLLLWEEEAKELPSTSSPGVKKLSAARRQGPRPRPRPKPKPKPTPTPKPSGSEHAACACCGRLSDLQPASPWREETGAARNPRRQLRLAASTSTPNSSMAHTATEAPSLILHFLVRRRQQYYFIPVPVLPLGRSAAGGCSIPWLGCSTKCGHQCSTGSTMAEKTSLPVAYRYCLVCKGRGTRHPYSLVVYEVDQPPFCGG
ncbi:hypothetical protein J3F83DRAFT_659938 [Trichoderma novae-zelandiae]